MLNPALAFDSSRGVTVLFGGFLQHSPWSSGQTWEWDGSSWSFRDVPSPPPRSSHAMAYDQSRGCTVIFGGYYFDGPLYFFEGDTWDWSGDAFLERTGPGPEAREYTAMAYDVSRRVAVLFGGWDGHAALSDTWELGPGCGSADFNHDSDAGTSADVAAFFACIAGDCCPACDGPDFDADGDVATDADIEAFFRVLGGGPC
jgi:hypothetical protein